MENVYKYAGKNVRIVSLYPDVHEYCRDYLSDECPDFEIVISTKDIEYELQKAKLVDEREGNPNRKHKNEELEKLAVYRKIAEKMIDYDTVLFHGSVICVDNYRYVFTAISGTGKSTHARLWRELLGEKAIMVNDDKPLIKICDDKVIAYGTPYDGKHRLSNNISAEVKAVSIINRSADNRIETITAEQAYPMFLQQCYKPRDPEKMAKTMQLLDRFVNGVKVYNMYCNMDIEAAKLAYRVMGESEYEVK